VHSINKRCTESRQIKWRISPYTLVLLLYKVINFMLQMVEADNVTGCSKAGDSLYCETLLTPPSSRQQTAHRPSHTTHSSYGPAHISRLTNCEKRFPLGVEETRLRNKESQSAYVGFSCSMQVSVKLPSLVLVNTHTPRLEGPLQTGK
jgi:hypothetical protein